MSRDRKALAITLSQSDVLAEFCLPGAPHLAVYCASSRLI